MSNPTENDDEFFRLIHRLKGESGEGGAERRRRGRHQYPAPQRIAPRYGYKLPRVQDFFEVACHDLNEGGFSFLLPAMPDFKRLVVALAAPQQLMLVAAEVVHTSKVLVHPSGQVEAVEGNSWTVERFRGEARGARPMAMVGCRFTDRLDPTDIGDMAALAESRS
jgi:hypothetical protein